MLTAILASVVATASSQCQITPDGQEFESGSVLVLISWELEPINCTLSANPGDWRARASISTLSDVHHTESGCSSNSSDSDHEVWDSQSSPANTSIQAGSAYSIAELGSLEGGAGAASMYSGLAVCSLLGPYYDSVILNNDRTFGNSGFEVTPTGTPWEVRVHFWVEYEFETMKGNGVGCGSTTVCPISYPTPTSGHPGGLSVDTVLGLRAEPTDCCDAPMYENRVGHVTLSNGEVSLSGFMSSADVDEDSFDEGCPTPPTGWRNVWGTEATAGRQYYNTTLVASNPSYVRAEWSIHRNGDTSSWPDAPMPQRCEGCECGCILDPNGDNAINGLDVQAIELCVGGDFSETRCCDLNGDSATNGADIEEMERRVGTGSCE